MRIWRHCSSTVTLCASTSTLRWCPKNEGLQALGRSRGGLGTKIHTTVALGNPLRRILTGGEVADVTQATALIEGFDAQTVVADKGYDDANRSSDLLTQPALPK